ncbi:MAG: hypothetical protein ABIJ96_13385 [Elusimicrobiota bacterium]
MLELFMIISLSPVIQAQLAYNEAPKTIPPTGIMTAAVKPCIWPNPCGGGDKAV